MHRLFANLGFLYGYSRFGFSDTTGFLVDASNNHFGIDGNAGYQFWMTSNANVSIRYRVFTLTQPNDFVQTELITFHGPEFSVGWVF